MQKNPVAAPLSKMQIIGILAERHGFTRYLELCTATTGNFYKDLDRCKLPSAHRLMYNCPADLDDGLRIDFRSEDMHIDQCLAKIGGSALRFDIILVDGFHEYWTTYRDLEAAFALVEAGGILVVHDCLPPNAALATPEFVAGAWCGATYKAYLDFVRERRLDYCTVDTDYGCGIIRKPYRHTRWAKLRATIDRPFRRSSLWREWQRIGNDFEWAFAFFQKHQKELLNLVSCDEFSEAR